MRLLRRLPPIFLIGLLPVVCLLWLWADSRQNRTIWMYSRDGTSQHVIWTLAPGLHIHHAGITEEEPSRDGPFIYDYDPPQHTGPFGKITHTPLRPGRTKRAVWFPPPSASEEKHTPRSQEFTVLSRAWFVPFWLILACYLPPWLLLAWWQARRRKKKHDAALPVAEGAEFQGS